MSPWQWVVFAVVLWLLTNAALVLVLWLSAPDIDRMSDHDFFERVDDDGNWSP